MIPLTATPNHYKRWQPLTLDGLLHVQHVVLAVPPKIVADELWQRGGRRRGRPEVAVRRRAGVAGVMHLVVNGGDAEWPALEEHSQDGGATGAPVQPYD